MKHTRRKICFFLHVKYLSFRCLTYGLPREGENPKSDKKKDDKFDEKEYQRYEDIRSKLNLIFDDATEIYKSKIQLATPEEVFIIDFSPKIYVLFKY
jgi:hypothetical protein